MCVRAVVKRVPGANVTVQPSCTVSRILRYDATRVVDISANVSADSSGGFRVVGGSDGEQSVDLRSEGVGEGGENGIAVL